jgi:hypothetical protein
MDEKYYLPALGTFHPTYNDFDLEHVLINMISSLMGSAVPDDLDYDLFNQDEEGPTVTISDGISDILHS